MAEPRTESGRRLVRSVDGWVAFDDNDIPIPVNADAMATAVAMIEAEAGRGIIVFDVDGTLSDGMIHYRATGRPGVRDLLDTLACLGFELVAWSAGGAEHAQCVVEALTLHGAIRRYAAKPDYPMTEEAAEPVIGGRPALQIDDDPTERVGSWPFMQWPRYTGPSRVAGSSRTSDDTLGGSRHGVES